MLSIFQKKNCWWLLVLTLSGCAGPHSNSPATTSFSQNAVYTGKLSRTLMMYPEATAALGLPEEFSQQLLERIAEDLGTQDLPSAILRLKTDRAERNKQIELVSERFNPSHALYLNPEKVSGAANRLTFTLRDVGEGKIVWRYQKEYASWPRPEELAAEVLKQWRAEGFISPKL